MKTMYGCVLIVAAVVCSDAAADSDIIEFAKFVGGPACPMVASERSLRSCELDTTWHALGNGLSGCRITNRKARWAVQTSWFVLLPERTELWSLAALDSLERAGAINDSTRMSPIGYRFMVKARSLEEVKRVAPRRVPRQPPKEVLRAAEP